MELTQVYPTVYQGKLEQSGVNLNNEMTRAMEVQRAFQSSGKALTIIDQDESEKQPTRLESRRGTSDIRNIR